MLRVIAGEAKGHRLKVPRGTITRPATDLVRGAIFSILEVTTNDWELVLDLFSGSGALGIEALSRGAGWVDFVERKREKRKTRSSLRTTLAIIASSLEKFATEIRGLQRTETREIEEPFGAGQTGSSAMPHKRNPELCERICGLSRLVRGYALTSMENIALWHERDISHSSTERIILPDSCLLLDYSVALFTSVMNGLQIYPQQMKRNIELTRGLVFSQRVMLALIDKGLSRQKAYELVQRNAMKSWKGNKKFLSLLKADPEVTASLPSGELEMLFDYQYYLRYIDEIFQRLGLTEAQWQEKPGRAEPGELAPRTI